MAQPAPLPRRLRRIYALEDFEPAARRHLPTLLCAGAAAAVNGASGCTACPSPARWPQTKFLVKRVSRALNDTTGVRAFIDALDPLPAAAGPPSPSPNGDAPSVAEAAVS